MVTKFKCYSRAAVRFLGNSAGRRAAAAVIALVATHLIGKALDADEISTVIEIGVGGIGAAWTGASTVDGGA